MMSPRSWAAASRIGSGLGWGTSEPWASGAPNGRKYPDTRAVPLTLVPGLTLQSPLQVPSTLTRATRPADQPGHLSQDRLRAQSIPLPQPRCHRSRELSRSCPREKENFKRLGNLPRCFQGGFFYPPLNIKASLGFQVFFQELPQTFHLQSPLLFPRALPRGSISSQQHFLLEPSGTRLLLTGSQGALGAQPHRQYPLTHDLASSS